MRIEEIASTWKNQKDEKIQNLNSFFRIFVIF